MCAVSGTLDYFNPARRVILDQQPVVWNTDTWSQFQEIIRRLAELDEKLGEPPCDPEKGAWMKDVEKRLAKLERAKAKKEMITIGIDPGLNGAIAYIFSDGPSAGHSLVFDAPTIKAGTRPVLLPALMKKLLPVHHREEMVAFIESVHSMPGQGVTSSFNFGYGFGIWIGILATRDIPYTLVTPQAWKKEMLAGLPKGKGSSILEAQRLFPYQADRLTRKKDEGRAEALLIAEYGRRQRLLKENYA